MTCQESGGISVLLVISLKRMENKSAGKGTELSSNLN